MNVLSGDAVSADFHKEKIGQFSGGLGGKTPSGVFASFCRYELKLGQKEVAAQSISFLGRIAFFMRGHTATKVWPEGHLLSSHEERRQRRAKGEPLGTPDALIFRAIVGLHNGGWPAPKFAGVESPSGAGPEFSLGKPAGGRTPEPAYIQKRGLGG